VPKSKENRSSEIKISCRNVWKVYGDDPDQFFNFIDSEMDDSAGMYRNIRKAGYIGAACDVNFDVHVGEIFVIMGLSGSGKSTVVRCISRLIEPTTGTILLGDVDMMKVSDPELIDIRRHKMGMVFQNFGLLPHLSVIDNIAFPLKVQGIAIKEREARAREVIDLVGLSGREHGYPRELSGGQQQRVGIARSLAVDPEVWLLDEPFSALDPLIRRQMQDEFLRLQKLLHKTIVFITHDFLEALRVADRIALMKDGWIVQIDTPANVVLHPKNDYVAEFTRDVPRVKVITAGEILQSDLDHTKLKHTVSANTTLEKLMPLFAKNPEGVAIEDSGTIVGSVTPQAVVNALASSEA